LYIHEDMFPLFMDIDFCKRLKSLSTILVNGIMIYNLQMNVKDKITESLNYLDKATEFIQFHNRVHQDEPSSGILDIFLLNIRYDLVPPRSIEIEDKDEDDTDDYYYEEGEATTATTTKANTSSIATR